MRAHHRQRFWQILLPAGLVILLGGIAAGLAAGSLAAEQRLWADVSLILILAPLLTGGVLCLVLLGVLIYSLARLTRITPTYTARAQDFTRRTSLGVRRVANAVTMPVLLLLQVRAGWGALRDNLTGKFRTGGKDDRSRTG